MPLELVVFAAETASKQDLCDRFVRRAVLVRTEKAKGIRQWTHYLPPPIPVHLMGEPSYIEQGTGGVTGIQIFLQSLMPSKVLIEVNLVESLFICWLKPVVGLSHDAMAVECAGGGEVSERIQVSTYGAVLVCALSGEAPILYLVVQPPPLSV